MLPPSTLLAGLALLGVSTVEDPEIDAWRIGLVGEQAPFVVSDPATGTVRGLYVDWWRAVAGTYGVEPEFEVCASPEDCAARIVSGELDMGGPTRFFQRNDRVLLTRPTSRRWVAVHRDPSAPPIRSASDLEGLRLAFVGTNERDLEEIRSWKPASSLRLEADPALGALSNGTIDAIVTGADHASWVATPGGLASNPLWFRWQYAWVDARRPDLLLNLEEAIDEAAANFAEFERRWLPPGAPSVLLERENRPAPSQAASKWLRDHPTIRLAASPWEPLAVEEDGHFDGLMLRLVRHHLTAAGVTPVFLGGADWEQIRDEARAGAYDGLGFLMSDSDPALLLSRSMIDLPMVVVCRRDEPFWSDVASLQGKRLIANQDYGELSRLERQGLPGKVVREVDPIRSLEGVRRGDRDAWIEYLPIVEYAIAQTDARDVKLAMRLGGPVNASIAVQPEWRPVLDLVDESIRKTGRDTLERVFGEWNRRFEPPQRTAWGRNLALAVIGVLVLGLIGLARNLKSERRTGKQREEALRRAQLLSRVGSFELRPPYTEVFLDGETPALFGLPPHQEARSLERLLSSFSTADAFRDALARVRSDSALERFDMRTLADPPQVYEVELAKAGSAGAPGTITGTLQNVTEKRARLEHEKKLEAEVLQLQKLDAVGQLAHGIAHDFNNILTASIVHNELAIEALSGEHPSREHMGQVLRASERSRELVHQILAFSRKRTSKMQPVRLDTLVQETAEFLRASIPATVRLTVDTGPDPVWVAGLSGELSQVLVNLATNAVDAMPDGGVLEITLSLEEHSGNVEHQGSPQQKLARLSVRDSGCGVPDAIRSRMFDPFVTTKPAGKSAGLGLSIVHGVVRAHEGQVEVVDEPGGGTRFVVTIPTTAPAPACLIPVPPPRRGDGRHLLFLDDEPKLVDVFRKMLTLKGYTVDAFESANQALEHLAENPGAFDAILTDLTMPEMTGIQFAKAARAIVPDTPLLLVTGYGVPDEGQGTELFQAVLGKPLRIQDLLEGLQRVFAGEAEEPASTPQGTTPA